MKAILRNKVTRLQALCALFAVGLMVAAQTPASATPATPDYAAIVNGAKTELTGALTAVGPVVFGILGILASIGFAWRYFKRAAKSS